MHLSFTPPDGSVVVQLDQIESGVRISVSDTGRGITPQDRPHIFEPFFRGSLSGQRKIKGTGLGLTIVKSILDQHGAEIFVESELGEGTTFSFVLKSA